MSRWRETVKPYSPPPPPAPVRPLLKAATFWGWASLLTAVSLACYAAGHWVVAPRPTPADNWAVMAHALVTGWAFGVFCGLTGRPPGTGKGGAP